VVTADTTGPGTVTATSGGVTSSAVSVTVTQAVATVEVTAPKTAFTALGETSTYTAVAKDAGGRVIAGASFAWSSSDNAVATVGSGTGLVTSAGNGTAAITATAGGVSGMATVTVSQLVATVTISPSSPAPLSALGATLQLTAEARDALGQPMTATMTWTSLAPAVATVSSGGLVTAESNGTAVIVAAAGDKADTVSVSVQPAVASVAVTPASVAMESTAADLQLTATAKDAGGAPVDGVAFTWASSNTAVVTVSASGVITPVADGTATVTATTAGVSGTNSVTITSGPLTRTFTGDASGDLLDPANWEPAGVPGPTDSLVIAAGTAPVLTGDFSIGTLTLEEGATLDIGSFDLTVSGDLVSGGVITGSGTVAMSGTDAAIAGTVPNLLVTGSVTAVGDVTVTGDFTVDGSASSFDVGSETVAIDGDLSTDNGALLVMSDPAAVLDIEGDLLLGGGDTDGFLSDGIIYLSGELVTVSVSFKTFNPDGNHTVVLNGTTQQRVYLYFPGVNNHRFQNLVIDNPAGVVFDTDVPILGDATILQGTVQSKVGTTTTVWAYGDINDAAGGRWRIARTVISGAAAVLPSALTTNLEFETATTLQSSFTVEGDLTVIGREAVLDLNGQDVTVAGDFSITDRGRVSMTAAAADLTVRGNTSFGGTSGSLFTAGRIWAEGDFTWVGNQAYVFAPSGSHEVVFSGTAPQQVQGVSSGVSAFQNVRVNAGADVTIVESVTVNGDMLLEGTFRIPALKTLTIAGTLTNTGTLVNDGTLIGG
ncbi:MAG: beta strand repeat-containing protein, partial [Longimicrobiales bacterium]